MPKPKAPAQLGFDLALDGSLMPHAKAPMGDDVPCYACPGRFSFSHEASSDRFVCRHTTPYCEAFEAIKTTIDALRHAEKCDAHAAQLERARLAPLR